MDFLWSTLGVPSQEYYHYLYNSSNELYIAQLQSYYQQQQAELYHQILLQQHLHNQPHKTFVQNCSSLNAKPLNLTRQAKANPTKWDDCKCPTCGKHFSRPWLLKGHMRTHTGERPFGCSECDKSFADKSNLKAHIQTHSDVKPFNCIGCGKSFALKSYLYKHSDSRCRTNILKSS